MLDFDKPEEKTTEEMLIRKAKQLSVRKDRSLSVNVGMIGILGGIIVIPIVMGVFAGQWLDKQYPSDNISWRLNLILIGFAFGLLNAYLWIKKEGEQIDLEHTKEIERMNKKDE